MHLVYIFLQSVILPDVPPSEDHQALGTQTRKSRMAAASRRYCQPRARAPQDPYCGEEGKRLQFMAPTPPAGTGGGTWRSRGGPGTTHYQPGPQTSARGVQRPECPKTAESLARAAWGRVKEEQGGHLAPAASLTGRGTLVLREADRHTMHHACVQYAAPSSLAENRRP